MRSARPRRSGNVSRRPRRLRTGARTRKDPTERRQRRILALVQCNCLPSDTNPHNTRRRHPARSPSSLYPTTTPATCIPTTNRIPPTARHTKASTANVRSFEGEQVARVGLGQADR